MSSLHLGKVKCKVNDAQNLNTNEITSYPHFQPLSHEKQQMKPTYSWNVFRYIISSKRFHLSLWIKTNVLEWQSLVCFCFFFYMYVCLPQVEKTNQVKNNSGKHTHLKDSNCMCFIDPHVMRCHLRQSTFHCKAHTLLVQ